MKKPKSKQITDTQRLNWLAKNPICLGISTQCGMWSIWLYDHNYRIWDDTARGVIDKAMKGQK